jgi:hypothetical protein
MSRAVWASSTAASMTAWSAGPAAAASANAAWWLTALVPIPM